MLPLREPGCHPPSAYAGSRYPEWPAGPPGTPRWCPRSRRARAQGRPAADHHEERASRDPGRLPGLRDKDLQDRRVDLGRSGSCGVSGYRRCVMKVRELMTGKPATVDTNATLGEVATLMKQEDCGSIPV